MDRQQLVYEIDDKDGSLHFGHTGGKGANRLSNHGSIPLFPDSIATFFAGPIESRFLNFACRIVGLGVPPADFYS